MKASKYNHGVFELAVRFPYEEDGFSHVDEIQKLSLAEAVDGTKFIMAHLHDSTGSIFFAQEIPQRGPTFSGSLFENKMWLPHNLTCYEFSPFMAISGAIKELPGYIHFDGVPYAMTGEHTASMPLSHQRDMIE